MDDFAARIRKTRLELGLTQEQVARAVGITKMGVSQWESGGKAPTGRNLLKLARKLDVRQEWLLEGRGPKEPRQGEAADRAGMHSLPLLDYVQAGAWTSPAGQAFAADSPIVYTSTAVSDRAFALRIKGRSMEPLFFEGDDIVIDPAVEPRSGDFVVAKREQDHEATFKQYRRRGRAKLEAVELVPLNRRFESLRIDRYTPGKIVGVMVEHRRYRR